MMKNIPIWFKLLIGFGTVIILLLISGGTAHYYLSSNLDSFTQYRGLARDTNTMGRVQANMLMVRMNVKDFLLTNNPKDLEEYDHYIKKTNGFMQESLREIQSPERAPLVKRAASLLMDYDKEFQTVKDLQKQHNKQVKILNSAGPALEKKLTAIMQTAHTDEDITAAYYTGRALRNLLLARLYVVKFLETNEQAAVDRVRAEFASFAEEYDILDREVENPDRRTLLAEVNKLKQKYLAAFEQSAKTIFQRNSVVQKKLNVWGPKIASDLESVKLSGKKDQDTLGPLVQNQSEKGKTLVGLLSLAAVLFGILAGFGITRGISKPLSEATAFADAVSKGNFKAHIAINQKDEVGKICAALNEIKDEVSKATNEVETVVSKVEKGYMRANGNTKAFSGSFAELVGGVNTLVGVYSNFLDQIPVGVMTLSKDHKVSYLNRDAQSISGTDSFEGKICSDLFNTGDCNSAACASDICMRSTKPSHSETTAEPSSGSYEISYTSIPLVARSGEIVGAAEIIIDQSKIKNAQKTMLGVAEQANEIADRVASASEELSAQVEQVSRGAEMQQQRVAETATAMEEMNSTVLEVARNASLATEQSDNAKEKADEGAELVSKVVNAINQVNGVAQDLQVNMENLGKQAESIGGVLTVITDIADQTNLLALNAAIEAARAGEAGRGFAVVADEVRKLAEKTMSATNEVGDNIRTIQSAAEANVKNVNRAVENITEATELANHSGESLEQIVTMSTESSSLISGIATAAEQQSAASEEINGAIEEVNQVVSETTDGMVQASQAVHELAKMALELKKVMSELSA